MRKRDLKKIIYNSFGKETPDLKDKILASCEKECQEPKAVRVPAPKKQRYYPIIKRIAVAVICLALFISGLSFGMLIPKRADTPTLAVADTETLVFLDVNPSIELKIDKNNAIIECIGANEDAKIILSGLKLDGVDMNTALTAIVGSMYVNGYLSADSNSILVSVDTKDEGTLDSLLTDISSKINGVFEKSGLTCSIVAQSVEVDDDLKQRANEHGVSVGKMHFVEKMVSGMDNYGDEDARVLADMSINELNLIYSTRPDKGTENDPFGKDVSHGDVGGFVKGEDALEILLAMLEIDKNQVKWYTSHAKYQQKDGKRQLIYKISVRFTDDESTYEFEVDCNTGEIVKIDHDMPGFTVPDGDGSFIREDEALKSVLNQIGKERAELEWFDLKLTPCLDDDSIKMIFLLQLRFVGEDTIHEYEIDCFTGEILSSTTTENTEGGFFAQPSAPDSHNPAHEKEPSTGGGKH